MTGKDDFLMKELKKHPKHQVTVRWQTTTEYSVMKCECKVFCKTCNKNVFGFTFNVPATG